jgi:SRSO17 transposase
MSTAPENATLEQLVFVTKMRRRIQRDYQDLMQEFGLGHYEGPGWRDCHHHASLSIAAFGFLMVQRLGTESRDGGKKTALNCCSLSFPRITSPWQSSARNAASLTRSPHCECCLDYDLCNG